MVVLLCFEKNYKKTLIRQLNVPFLLELFMLFQCAKKNINKLKGKIFFLIGGLIENKNKFNKRKEN
jgi:hypothetical protein